MKYPGQPKTPPAWYNDRGQSHIEKEFSKHIDDLAAAIEAEHWFGDAERHDRYRVDFLLKDARLIVELDGHDFHSTKEQLERDAIRQRYLSRAGYTVIRFTGREIVRDAAACVDEVRTTYKERMQRRPPKHRVLYIDYLFLRSQSMLALRFYKDLHGERPLSLLPLDQFVPHAVEWLHEKSFIVAFIFCSPQEAEELAPFDLFVKEYEKGEIRMSVVSAPFYSVKLCDHLESYSHLFDEFYLIADDAVYIEPLRAVLPKEFTPTKIGSHSFDRLANGKLLRKGNDETAFAGTDLARVQWQDIAYVIGASMGLALHEL
jgi:very-short-patch-repair endonuclease